MNLYQFDMNLLVIFEMIYQEKHLTKAGERLNLSQPAMSQSLARLRDHFEDSLFVREGNQMMPTAKAQLLAPQVQQILSLTKKTLADGGNFDPATSTRTFRLALNDYTESVLLPRLFHQVSQTAPKIKILCKHPQETSYQEALNSNYVDLILGDWKFGSNILQQFLFKDHDVAVIKKGSPILEQELTPEWYAAQKHAQFSFYEQQECDVERGLSALNLKRQIALEVQHELVLPLVLKDNDLVLTIPLRMAKVFQEIIPLEICPLPVPINDFEVFQYWHEHNHNDPAHQWLRAQIKKISQEMDV